MELKKGSRLDILDTVSKWYTGSVLEEKGDRIFVNYDGMKFIFFFLVLLFSFLTRNSEWSSKFDEWLFRTSDRIAPYKTYALGGKSSGGVQHVYQEKTIDDSADPEDAFAVFRVRFICVFVYVAFSGLCCTFLRIANFSICYSLCSSGQRVGLVLSM